jgi:hypothetical protein
VCRSLRVGLPLSQPLSTCVPTLNTNINWGECNQHVSCVIDPLADPSVGPKVTTRIRSHCILNQLTPPHITKYRRPITGTSILIRKFKKLRRSIIFVFNSILVSLGTMSLILWTQCRVLPPTESCVDAPLIHE